MITVSPTYRPTHMEAPIAAGEWCPPQLRPNKPAGCCAGLDGGFQNSMKCGNSSAKGIPACKLDPAAHTLYLK